MQDYAKKHTDWTTYYKKPFFASRFTRKILQKHLIKAVRKCLTVRQDVCIAEFGGGASCYMNALLHNFSVRQYHIFDNNSEAMNISASRAGDDYESFLSLHEADLLKQDRSKLEKLNCHLVFSGGLIEHFSPEDTGKLIRMHFDAAVPGGLVILLFPVNSILYRITRKLAEWLTLWIFHDERPLTPLEVIQAASPHGDLVYGRMIHSIFLSQAILVFRKR